MDDAHRAMLDLAARLALRGAGHVEPNPMVGAALVDQGGRVIGLGHHRRHGGPHAEREALADCLARGYDPRGATMYVTLEPCSHHGKTPPCTDALIEAGISRVVAARQDPNPVSAGGAEVLRRAGIDVEFCGTSGLALAVGAPFIKRITTGLPWVIAKWAQFPDGRMATAPGEDRWISNEVCRRRVHRLRGRVDAVLTGIGTVLADDPLLTVRGVRPRRTPIRVVLDPDLRTPMSAALVRTAGEVRTAVVCDAGVVSGRVADSLRARSVEVWAVGAPGRRNLREVLGAMSTVLGAASVLIEAGPSLLGTMLGAGLVDEAVVHTAGAAAGAATRAEAGGLVAVRTHRYGGDTETIYRRPRPAPMS